MEQVVCACGCDRPIPFNPRHKERQSRYLVGHASPEGREVRRLGRIAARFAPPPGWRAPSGVCECGCGETTLVATITRRDRDQYRGHPLRFVNGHNNRGVVGPAKTSSWKGGRYVHQTGYIYVYAPDHPRKNADGYVLEHRLVYEQAHGVTLTPADIIHHMNGQRADNRPANLHRTNRANHSGGHDALGAWRDGHPEEARRYAIEGGNKGAAKRWGQPPP